jgi:tetratricopeptide (TPR) repeat protein/tRNA A-37 threonylcarbamoyl transferase component Bud32
VSDSPPSEPSGEPATLPPPTSEEIEAACDAFEAAWQAALAGGPRPAIEDRLAGVAEPMRLVLLRELVLYEVYYRARAGEEPRPEDYLGRFPGLSRRWLERKLRGPPKAAAAPPLATPPTGRAPEGDTGPEVVADPKARGAGPAGAAGAAGPGVPAGPAVPGYEVLGELGRGGMSVVYKARQVKPSRAVALKMILQPAYADAEKRRRLEAEAEAIARLRHPNIVQIHEVGEHEGLPYLSLEYCPGGSLADKLDGTPWEARPAAALAEALARAVHAAHQAQVVHRDLKPGNVLLTEDGTPKVTDFGLAKRLDLPGQTRTGAVMGTPSYMAPEQARAHKEVGPGADVYGLGAILYELLTGRPPFRGATPMDTVLQVLSDEPVPVRRLQPKVPRDLETICHKCLEKDPARRYPSAAALAEDLGRWRAGSPVRARPVGHLERAWKWSRRNPAVAALLAAVLLVFAAGTIVSALFAVEARRQAAAQSEARRRTREALDEMSSQVIEDWLAQKKELEPAQRAFLEKALAYYEAFAREAGNTEEVRQGVADAHLRVGDIRFRLGHHAEAEAAYGQALELYTRLAADFPGARRHRQQLAATWNNLANVLAATGHQEKAAVAYREAQDIQRRLIDEFPDVPSCRQELARSQINLGNLLRATGHPTEAAAAWREAEAVQQRLVADFRAEAPYRRELAVTKGNLGNLLRETGHPSEAAAALREALALDQALADEFPKTPLYRQELARTHVGLGLLLRGTDRAKAEEAYGKARSLYAPLAAQFPARPQYREELAMTYGNLGNLLRDAGRLREAGEAWHHGLALLRRLVEDYPGVAQYRRGLAVIGNNLGVLLQTTGRPQEAEGAYKEAMTALESLAAAFPAEPDYRADLANTKDNLAELLGSRRDYPGARRLLEDARRHLQKALDANPRNPFYRAVLRENRQLLATTLLELGEHAGAAAAAADLALVAREPAGDAFKAAGFFARCIPLAEKDTKLSEVRRKELAKSYGDQAVEALRQAVARGYKDAAHLKKDRDLDPLRGRDDFKRLLAEVEAAARPKEGARP